ncbi:hypothetical protein PR048_008709 [Dryococelus australis]|uniref:Uncharacterized protein n=1 Tax=Dryococelus australis TaxID=614101 RepID=A0ABQ9HXV6_9NEOP|nr:hypothetical protein PR048_008709 [Dryococelus australis]
MMQTVYNNSNPQYTGKATIRFLPIINIAPITFDKSLYWKASQIIHEYKDLENTVLMLGSFHTLMNLVGSIGTLMKGSCLNEVLQEIYGSNTVLHMMSGKDIFRAIHGHMLVHAALSTLLVADMFPCNEDGSCQKFIKTASTLFDSIMSGKEYVENAETSDTMCEIANDLKKKKLQLQSSETSKLWLAYQEMVQTVYKLITADRTSSW